MPTADVDPVVEELRAKLAEVEQENEILRDRDIEMNDELVARQKEIESLKAIAAAKPKKGTSSHCADSKGNALKVIEVMQAQELAERIKYNVVGADRLVGLLADAK